MGYDLQIYSCHELADSLAREKGVSEHSPCYHIDGNSWQVVICPDINVELEDLSPEVIKELPGLRYATSVAIEGHVTKTVIARIGRLTRKLAKAARGVIVDPQRSTVETPRGIRRVDLVSSVTDSESVTLSWWFEDDEQFIETGCTRLIRVFELLAPEALPRRYGLWEPPQYSLQSMGLVHFLSFLQDNFREIIVWYPDRPFNYVDLSIPVSVGPSTRGYRSCLLSIKLQADILEDTAWRLAIKRLWISVSEVVSAFFAEVRLGESPVQSWWWNGIPRTLGYAVLIGAPYTGLWRSFAVGAGSVPGDFIYHERLDDLELVPIEVPPSVAQPIHDTIEQNSDGLVIPPRYPEIWPFKGPFE